LIKCAEFAGLNVPFLAASKTALNVPFLAASKTALNVPFLAASKTVSYWKLNTDAVTEVVICEL
jgi:hypothetical protein